MKVVIVGAVAGGATFATSLRRLDENVEIVMFEKDRDMSFGNCELPYYLSYQIKDSALLVHRNSEKFKKGYNIDAYNYHEIISINRHEKYVTVLDKKCGKEFNETYDYLVLAPGAHPNIPKSIKGTDKDHVFTIRNVMDVENIRNYYEENDAKNILVAGGGFIAIEAAHALNELDDTNVSMFVRSKILGMIDDELAPFIEENIKENDVNIIHEKELVEIRNDEVVFASGKKVRADMVILALGMAANNKLAVDAGLEITDKGSIVTDENYQTTDPSIYAIGDAIDITNFITNEKQNLKLAWPAHRQGKFLAKHLLGMKAEPLKYIGTFLIKSFDLNIGMTGLNEKSLQKLGYNYDVTLISHSDKVGIMPSSEMVYMKLLFEKETGKIYGAQAVGKGVVDKRIDVIATLIKMGGTLSDLYNLELGYQPYYSTTEDINNVIANQAINICKGRLPHVKFYDFCYTKDDYEIIDIRNKSAFEKCHIKGARLFEASKLREEYEKLPKNKKILFYDETGVTSSNMIKMLNNFAYNNIYMLDGGLLYFRKYDDYFKLNMLC
ncbi:FAD-dependent oxidoreductase [Anaerococcus sp.]|uniref:FAD-dependent oxidoreductase n=1 Tax=Anaerococcus sp. TaxID=1872515 RepID=UPI00280AA1D3|nr:FAD-dependent oxidoreductase [Anaerococcus sp.]MDU3176780.1 FAD-dependent oxidoreductase [Anaerococcus sp.]